MKNATTVDLPVREIRRCLEPGPVVLVSSCWKQQRNVMTMGWHTMLEFTPSFVGCVIASGNHSFALIRRSRQCVINIPSDKLLDEVVCIGNCSGASVDKFARFGLLTTGAEKVGAPLPAQCFVNLECRLHDQRLVAPYNFFIFEGGKGASGHPAASSADHSLHRRRRVHVVRQNRQPATPVRSRHALSSALQSIA